MKDKEEFFTHFRRKPVKVSIGSRKVWLLPLSRGDVTEIVAQAEGGVQAGLAAVRSLCTPEGERIFKDEELKEYRFAVPLVDQDAIYDEVRKLNKLGDDEGKGDSPATSSSSTSPATSA